MSWACELSRDAEKDLRGLPKAIQKRVGRVLSRMEADPFQGDVTALHGDEWQGILRRRIGDYRLLFTLDHKNHIVLVIRILLRSEKTYR